MDSEKLESKKRFKKHISCIKSQICDKIAYVTVKPFHFHPDSSLSREPLSSFLQFSDACIMLFNAMANTIFISMDIIIITRPKPGYGRQRLVGQLGQDTDQAGTFWGVLNISLRAFGAQLGFKPTRKMKNHKKQPGITKHLHGTMNNHNNYLEPKITIKFHL